MPTNTYAPDSGLGEVAAKVGSLVGAARGNGNMLDSLSATAQDVVKNAVADAKNLLPDRMARLLDQIDGDGNRALAVSSLLDGIANFERRCGFTPSADMLDAVISQAENLADGKSSLVLPHGTTLDSISTNNASATLSHQPNRIAVAITGGLSEAIPFGAYLPSDLSSNESKLAIITSIAGSNFGAYSAGDIIDGTAGGREYTRSERVVDVVVDGARTGGTFAIKSQVGGAGTTVPLLRNRTSIVVNGFPVAFEQTNNSGTATSLISGQFKVGAQDYVINGSVNVTTGAGTLTFAPALAADIDVEAQGFIDFEAKPELAPNIGTIAQSYSLYCAPTRLIMQATPDSRSQSQSELGADRLTIAVQAARTQLANERYISALHKVRKLAKNTSRTYDFNAAEQLLQKTRAQGWRDFGAFVAAVDQDVANQTMEFGLSFMYVGEIGMAQFLSMDKTDFVSSGVAAKPGIWRVGRYKDKFDVYYTPYVVEETDTDIEILCIGRSPQVARNPIVFSDAVSPTLIPLAVNSDLKTGAALFSRQLTEVNPHKQSALGCALITVKNVFALG
ncbi:hypothetical protein [Pseudomonas sp. UMAB-40]|uniref:hypothetical protein n=1 Tax=Pseudomonas sp. UMAB-40 TaxID=1365407 RepID=UPI001C59C316|nr:hypothetical protein [Pseudomonas sp. UMAB-40]